MIYLLLLPNTGLILISLMCLRRNNKIRPLYISVLKYKNEVGHIFFLKLCFINSVNNIILTILNKINCIFFIQFTPILLSVIDKISFSNIKFTCICLCLFIYLLLIFN